MPRRERTLGFHVASALLGTGDLHPGGATESERLVAALAAEAPGRALEIGAGAGRSTARLQQAGFDVTVVERDPRLAARLANRGVRVISASLSGVTLERPVDVVLAESVLYGMPLDESFSSIWNLLRPGGLLGFIDMVWTSRATADGAADISDRSLAAFGIAMASREPLTWQDWRSRLVAQGFRICDERRLGDGSPRGSQATRAGWRARLRHPLAALALARYQRRARSIQPPAGWLESWSCVAERL